MSVFEAVYSPELQNSPLRSTAERASQTLREFTDPSLWYPLFAEWDIVRQGTGSALRLRLKQDEEEVTAVFQPADLGGQHGWTQLIRTYRRLVRSQIRRSLDKLRPTTSQNPVAAVRHDDILEALDKLRPTTSQNPALIEGV